MIRLTTLSRKPSSNCHAHFSFRDIHHYQELFGLAKASPVVQGSMLTSTILDLKNDFKSQHGVAWKYLLELYGRVVFISDILNRNQYSTILGAYSD
jgi:hypothetical protein